MKKKSNFLVIAMVMLGLTTMLSSCGQAEKKSATEKIKEKGELVIATSGNQFPFSFKDKETGKLSGVDIKLGDKIAESMGVKAKYVEQDLSTIIDFVSSGKADLAISSLTVTDERSKLVSFSDPYFVTGKGMLSKYKDLRGRKEGEGVKEEMYTIAVVENSSSVDYAKEHYPKANLLFTKNIKESKEALYTEQADGLLADYEICETLSFDKRNTGDYNFHRVGDASVQQNIAVAVVPGDSLLLNNVNALVHKIKKGLVDQMVENEWMNQLN